MSFVFVALGGAIGAVARYAISLIPVKSQFPILTLVTNILGAVLIGFVVGMTDKKQMYHRTQCYSGKPAFAVDLRHSQPFLLKRINCLKTRRTDLGDCM